VTVKSLRPVTIRHVFISLRTQQAVNNSTCKSLQKHIPETALAKKNYINCRLKKVPHPMDQAAATDL